MDDDETTPSVSSVRPPPPPPPPPPPLPPAVTPGAEALEPWARRPASRAAAAVVDDTLLRAAREDGAADAAVAVAYDVVHTPEPKHPRGKRAAAAATAKAPPAAPSPPPPPPSATASARSAGSAAAANRADVQLLSELRDEVRQVKELREQQLEVLRQRTSAGPPPASARAAATTSVAVKSKTTSPPLPQSSTPTPPPLSKPPVAAMPVSPTWTSATESESEDDRHATPAASVRSQPAAQAPVQNQAPPVRVPEEPIAEPGAPVPSSSGASSSQESAGLSPTDMTRLHEHLASLDLRHLSHADIYRYLQFLSYAEDPISENWRLALIQVLESMDASRQPSAAPPVAGTSRTNGYESSGSPTASRVAHYLAYSEENSVPSDGSVPPTGQRPLTMADLEINVTPRRRGTTPTMSEVARLAYHRSRGGAVQAAVQQEVRRDLATAHQMMHRDASARRHARYRRSFPGAGSSPASNPVAPAPALHPHPPLSAAVAAAAATAASRNTESPEMVPREEIDALITLIRSTNEQVGHVTHRSICCVTRSIADLTDLASVGLTGVLVVCLSAHSSACRVLANHRHCKAALPGPSPLARPRSARAAQAVDTWPAAAVAHASVASLRLTPLAPLVAGAQRQSSVASRRSRVAVWCPSDVLALLSPRLSHIAHVTGLATRLRLLSAPLLLGLLAHVAVRLRWVVNGAPGAGVFCWFVPRAARLCCHFPLSS